MLSRTILSNVKICRVTCVGERLALSGARKFSSEPSSSSSGSSSKEADEDPRKNLLHFDNSHFYNLILFRRNTGMEMDRFRFKYSFNDVENDLYFQLGVTNDGLVRDKKNCPRPPSSLADEHSWNQGTWQEALKNIHAKSPCLTLKLQMVILLRITNHYLDKVFGKYFGQIDLAFKESKSAFKKKVSRARWYDADKHGEDLWEKAYSNLRKQIRYNDKQDPSRISKPDGEQRTFSKYGLMPSEVLAMIAKVNEPSAKDLIKEPCRRDILGYSYCISHLDVLLPDPCEERLSTAEALRDRGAAFGASLMQLRDKFALAVGSFLGTDIEALEAELDRFVEEVGKLRDVESHRLLGDELTEEYVWVIADIVKMFKSEKFRHLITTCGRATQILDEKSNTDSNTKPR